MRDEEEDFEEVFIDDTEVLTKDEFIEVMLQAHDLALYLLSQRCLATSKTIRDQLEFTEKMLEAMEDDLDSFSTENVSATLPNNSWLETYLQLTSQIEALFENNESFGKYHA